MSTVNSESKYAENDRLIQENFSNKKEKISSSLNKTQKFQDFDTCTETSIPESLVSDVTEPIQSDYLLPISSRSLIIHKGKESSTKQSSKKQKHLKKHMKQKNKKKVQKDNLFYSFAKSSALLKLNAISAVSNDTPFISYDDLSKKIPLQSDSTLFSPIKSSETVGIFGDSQENIHSLKTSQNFSGKKLNILNPETSPFLINSSIITGKNKLEKNNVNEKSIDDLSETSSKNIFYQLNSNKIKTSDDRNLKSNTPFHVSVLSFAGDCFSSNLTEDKGIISTSDFKLENINDIVDDGDVDLDQFMELESKKYEAVNESVSGAEKQMEDIGIFINDLKKEERKQKIKEKKDKIKNIFSSVSNFSASNLTKSPLSLYTSIEKIDIIPNSLSVTEPLTSLGSCNNMMPLSLNKNTGKIENSIENNTTLESCFSEHSSHYPQTNLSPPESFLGIQEMLENNDDTIATVKEEENSILSLEENESFLQNGKNNSVTMENRFHRLKRAGTHKWSKLMSNFYKEPENSHNNLLNPETGISVNTIVKKHGAEELSVLKKDYASGLETEILRKLHFKLDDNEENLETQELEKSTTFKFAPKYQKYRTLHDLIKDGANPSDQISFSPLKGSDTTDSETHNSRFSRKWWIFGTLGERHGNNKNKNSYLSIDSSKLEPDIVLNKNKKETSVSYDSINMSPVDADYEILSKNIKPESMLRKLARNLTKKGKNSENTDTNFSNKESMKRDKALSVSFVKYTTNIYDDKNSAYASKPVTSDFQTKSILKNVD
ncbi:hypothetical protein HANVADRAFT_53865 [Hanseniaspora valbyensis NRRL Y-1626]|uniref:Uncharacterized protein n=1 Tax=Hanseniaspora valbyensis NRRL Y-1626 TaxID=766949 RepID=A0A1B7T9Z3_9ASCO|nr:hypothetical protein HANVADRAFT_53865 [Hanseniaspora valbyensis NRRL Y-1626]